MPQHLISDDAGELIIEQEVSGQAAYIKRYQHPERPGGQSGITIAIGYDCGYSTSAQIRKDWGGRIPAEMVEVLATRCAKLTGSAAQERLAEVRPKIIVPWDAALAEFYDVEVPRWLAKCGALLPNFDVLPPDCQGAICSLAYNRGPSFATAGERYAEMRAIRAHMIAKEFRKIPAEFRKMKRLWPQPSMRGLIGRREEEAKLFERGLASMPAVAGLDPAAEPDDDQIAARMPVDAGDDRHLVVDAAPTGVATTEDAPETAAAAIEDDDLYAVKRRLKAMNYNPGVLNGQWGGMTAGAIAGFINDRGGRIAPPASLDAFNQVKDELRTEITRAEDQKPPFVRPVSEARANADANTVATVAPEVVPAKRNFFKAALASVGAFFTAIGTAVSDKISAAWDFFTDHKDDLGDSSSWISTAWGYLGEVPTSLWILLGAAGLAWIAYDARDSINKITNSVQTGARQ